MEQRIEGEEKIRQYLLGELTDDEQTRLEERLLRDDDFLKQIQIAEDELTDDYLHGALSNREQERFEKHFLSAPERRKKLKFSSAFKKYISDTAVKAEVVEKPTSTATDKIWFLQSLL